MIQNFDEETGIHYGVVSANSIHPDAADNIYNEGVDETAEEIEHLIKDAVEELANNISDWVWDNELSQLKERIYNEICGAFYDSYEPNEPLIRYETSEYTILYSTSSNVLIVVKSQYLTWSNKCSPCYTNAGDLDTPGDDFKTYCLGPEFFEDDRAPYRWYKVSEYVDEEVDE